MDILFTGGTGFFGLSVLRSWATHLGEKFPTIIILSRNPDRFKKNYPELASRVGWARGDVLDPSSLPRDRQFTHVIHAAADSTIGPSLKPLDRYDQIVSGTRNVLDLAKGVGASRFLFISSGGVYGEQPTKLEKVPENMLAMPDPLVAENSYSVAKRSAEHLCALYREASGIQIVIARCFAFVGSDLPLNAHFAIGNFIRDALWGEKIVVSGDGTDLRSYLDQRDLAFWLLEILKRGSDGHAYNVGSDRPISIADLAHLVRDLAAPEKSVEVMGHQGFSQSRSRYIPDISKARRELGLEVTIGLEQAIVDAANAHRE
jgi:UDP-glucuronate decarboxylase